MRSLARKPLVLFTLFLLYSVALGAGVAYVVRGSPGAAASALHGSHTAATPGAGKPVTFVVDQGAAAEEIADKLVEDGVLSDKTRFEVLLNLTGGSADLDAGCYVFAEDTPAAEVVLRLRSGLTSLRSVPIPEGRRAEEIGAAFAKAGITTTDAWRDALANADRSVLPEQPPDDSLNGYLFPATYPIECQADAPRMVQAMLQAFSDQVTPEMVQEAHDEGMTLNEVVTLASIVEREAAERDEQPVIASVFLNRLKEDMPLQADPTVQYALASADPPTGDASWWKSGLTEDDLGVESPYNTYLHRGLPPGPIANPGIDAIEAVLHPAATDYLYFVAKGDGSHAFAATLAEHNANVERYQN
jgi:UPF0755 protein